MEKLHLYLLGVFLSGQLSSACYKMYTLNFFLLPCWALDGAQHISM